MIIIIALLKQDGSISLGGGVFLRHPLHRRGFQSKWFHDLETALETTQFQSVYTKPIQPFKPNQKVFLPRSEVACSLFSFRWTILIHHITYKNFFAHSEIFLPFFCKHDTVKKVVTPETSSPRPNPESLFCFLLLFVTLERIDEKVNISRPLLVVTICLLVYRE